MSSAPPLRALRRGHGTRVRLAGRLDAVAPTRAAQRQFDELAGQARAGLFDAPLIALARHRGALTRPLCARLLDVTGRALIAERLELFDRLLAATLHAAGVVSKYHPCLVSGKASDDVRTMHLFDGRDVALLAYAGRVQPLCHRPLDGPLWPTTRGEWDDMPDELRRCADCARHVRRDELLSSVPRPDAGSEVRFGAEDLNARWQALRDDGPAQLGRVLAADTVDANVVDDRAIIEEIDQWLFERFCALAGEQATRDPLITLKRALGPPPRLRELMRAIAAASSQLLDEQRTAMLLDAGDWAMSIRYLLEDPTSTKRAAAFRQTLTAKFVLAASAPASGRA